MVDLDIVVFIIVLLTYLLTIIITLRLYTLANKDRYWIGFPLAVIAFTFHETVELYSIITNTEVPILLAEILELSGALFLLYAAFGLSSILKNVNKYLDDEKKEEK